MPLSVGVLKCSLEVDVDAIDKCLDDISDDRNLYPCVVHADGNCLPSCGSVFALERPNYTSEIRVRIIKELGGGRVVRWCWVNFQCRGVLQF